MMMMVMAMIRNMVCSPYWLTCDDADEYDDDDGGGDDDDDDRETRLKMAPHVRLYVRISDQVW